jgi:hypothetical protein
VERQKQIREAKAALEQEVAEKAKARKKDDDEDPPDPPKVEPKAQVIVACDVVATHAKNGKPGSLVERMRERLKRGGWRSPYRLRKQVDIKQGMGFHLRAKPQGEWLSKAPRGLIRAENPKVDTQSLKTLR